MSFSSEESNEEFTADQAADDNAPKSEQMKLCIFVDQMKLLLSTSNCTDAHLLVGPQEEGNEKFIQNCLAYIDKNAAALIRSEEFLRIDQQLLCEILARDTLQIGGEISIWQAALRWADAKCCENARKCTAENRRAMLGPALFKIRFPLISKEEFTRKIVPSGILAMEEVISIYQFYCHPNIHGISDGLCPVQFQISGRISDRKRGTLLMDIEKLSEFMKEAQGRVRCSGNAVYILGHPWKILAQINTDTQNNEKCLGFWLRLLCSALNGGSTSACVCSATFRIISQSNPPQNHIGKRNKIALTNKANSCGFTNFITFAELMNLEKGFYNRAQDKVTLAVDVTVDVPKREEPIGQNHAISYATISMQIGKVSEFAQEINGSGRKSETVYIKGLPWQIEAQVNMGKQSAAKCLGIYLWCAASNEENWSCKCFSIVRIVSLHGNAWDKKSVGIEKCYNNKFNSWGFLIITFGDLMDPQKGFYDKEKDSVTLAIDFAVKDAKRDKCV